MSINFLSPNIVEINEYSIDEKRWTLKENYRGQVRCCRYMVSSR